MVKYDAIMYEVTDGILTITLNRPEKLNAVNHTMETELLDAFNRADADDDIRAIIVTGAGRAFSSGADIGGGGFELGKEDATVDTHRDEGGIITLRIYDLKKPTIAAINGLAVGFGVTLTLPMDIRLASEDARMAFVFTRRGVVMESCSSWFLPRIVGIGKAAEWVITGKVVGATEALKHNLVNEVLPSDSLVTRAREIASDIVQNTSAISVCLCRQLLWKMLGANHPIEAHRLDSKYVFWTSKQADAREGVLSFMEKRPPKFPMKPSRDMPKFYPWWSEQPFR
jgi:enoyl-CoA hydratase/carnithine racemase